MSDADAVWLETTDDRHTWRVGGVAAVERRVRELAKQGATRVVVAASAWTPAREWPIPVEFAGAGAEPPADARRERADVIAGIELVDEPARRRAEWALIRRMNKSFEGPVDALINWRFSMRITRVLAQRSLAVTPNQVTMCAILLGIAASVVLARGSYAAVAVAGVMLELNSILDSVDGELARLRLQYSKLGQWLDNLSDDLVDNLFIACAGVAVGGPWLWIGLAAASGRVFHSLVTYASVYRQTGTGDIFAFRWWFEQKKLTADDVYDPRQVSTWLRSFGRRDTYVFIWMIACLAGFPQWIIGHGAVIAATNLALLVLHFGFFSGRVKSADD